MDNKFSWGERY